MSIRKSFWDLLEASLLCLDLCFFCRLFITVPIPLVTWIDTFVTQNEPIMGPQTLAAVQQWAQDSGQVTLCPSPGFGFSILSRKVRPPFTSGCWTTRIWVWDCMISPPPHRKGQCQQACRRFRQRMWVLGAFEYRLAPLSGPESQQIPLFVV